MEFACVLLLVGGWFLGQEPPPDARAVIKKAIAAHGETYQSKPLALHEKSLNKEIRDNEIVLESEGYKQPDGAFRYSMKIPVDKLEAKMTAVYDGTKGWMKFEFMGQSGVKEFDDKTYELTAMDAYLARVGFMVDLLADPAFALKHLGVEKLKGQEVVAVLVAAKGKPGVRIYIDKATHLVAGWRYLKKDKDDKEVEHLTNFSDYRTLGLTAQDAAILKRANIPASGDDPLGQLRKLIPTKAEQEAMKDLVAKLGDANFKIREDAMLKLKKRKALAIGPLREAARHSQPEIARRAEHCLKALEEQGLDQLPVVLLRLVGYTRPKGAVEGLLDYLPHAQNTQVLDELKAVLVLLAQDNGKPHPLLEEALSSKESLRRVTAEAVLGKDGGTYLKRPGRPLYLANSRFPAKSASYEDGKLVAERTILELRYFNRFADALFHEPK